MTVADGAQPSSGYPDRLRPRPLEIVTSLPFGTDEESTRLPIRGAATPQLAIEAVIRDALSRSPCAVSFSGGRDSSAVLATAAAVARREGLPLPVPITLRFPHAPGSHESDWQEQVVRHLELPDWERIELTSELDLIGPVAQAGLRRHGLLWPPFSHFHVPIFERATGRTVLTGIGGDEVVSRGALGWLRGRPRTWVGRSNLRTVAVVLAPEAVRRRVFAREAQVRFPWLHHHVEADVTRRRNAWRARSPDRWDAGIAQYWRTRYTAIQVATLEQLASDAGTEVVNVFVEPSVVGAMARHFGFRGPSDRTSAMRELFGSVLPDAVVTRRGKAFFDEAYLGERSCRFAASWDGGGIDETLVDPARLAAHWRAGRPDVRSSSLLQHAWLASI